MKIELGAVIPTVQYGNLQPKFEMELPKDGMSEDDIPFARPHYMMVGGF